MSPLASPPTSSSTSDNQDELLESLSSMDEPASALCDAIEATVVATTTLVSISLPLCEESTLALFDAIEETTPAGLSWRWYLETLWDLGLWSGVFVTMPRAQWYFRGLMAQDFDFGGHAKSHNDFSKGDFEVRFLAMPTSVEDASSQHLAALVTKLEQWDSLDLPLFCYTSLGVRFLQSSHDLAVLGTLIAQMAFERLSCPFATSWLVRLLQCCRWALDIIWTLFCLSVFDRGRGLVSEGLWSSFLLRY